MTGVMAAVPLCGIKQEMEVIGQEHPADEPEPHLLPQVRQCFHKAAAKTLREEKGRTPVGAGGVELQLSRTVMALVERHDAESIRRPPVREESLRDYEDYADPKNQGSAPAGPAMLQPCNSAFQSEVISQPARLGVRERRRAVWWLPMMRRLLEGKGKPDQLRLAERWPGKGHAIR